RRVRKVRPPDPSRVQQLDARRRPEACPSEERPRPAGVRGVPPDGSGVTGERRRRELMRDRRAGAVRPPEDRGAIEPVRERLPQERARRRREGLIAPEVADIERGTPDAPPSRPSARVTRALLVEILDVDRAVTERVEPFPRVVELPEDEPWHACWLSPVRGVADEHDLLAGRPRLEPEGTRPGRMVDAVRAARDEVPVRVDYPVVGPVTTQC